MTEVVREAQIHFALHNAFTNVIEREKSIEGVFFDKPEPEYPIKGVGRADLVLFDKSKNPWLVIETKSTLEANDPYSPKVIDQAMGYANWIGAYYFATCGGKTFVLFDNKEKGISFWERKRTPPLDLRRIRNLDDVAERVLHHIVDLDHGKLPWCGIDEAFVYRLRDLHGKLVNPFTEAIVKARKTSGGFRSQYDRWVKEQGLEPTVETNSRIGTQAAYLLINKILFYKVLETKYSQLPRLEGFEGLLDRMSVSTFREELEGRFRSVLEIDYQSVFHSTIYDQIPLPTGAIRKLNEFLSEAAAYDLSKIESDVIGRIYEGLIPRQERRDLGQYYTPPAICDLIVRLCVKNRHDMVLDPGCGSGGFLVKAYHQLLSLKGDTPGDSKAHHEILDQLWGVDISQFPAHLSVINLALRNLKAKSDKINVLTTDFFRVIPKQKILTPIQSRDLDEGERHFDKIPQFDAVVCNPPYTRQDDIGDERYREALRKIALAKNGGLVDISHEAGMYAYFLTHASHFLREGGEIGFITSNTWMEVKFGVGIQAFLLDNFKLESIIEFDNRAFEDASINTCVIIGKKSTKPGSASERETNQVRFVRVKDALPTEAILDIVQSGKKTQDNPSFRIVTKSQAQLRKDPKWLKYLRAPAIYFRLRDDPMVTTLGALVDIKVGVITYANAFFQLPPDRVKQWHIESRYLKPLLTSPRELEGIEVEASDVKNRLFFTNESKRELEGTAAFDYVKWGESIPVDIRRGATKGSTVRGYNNIPSFKGKARWYAIDPRPPPPIIVPTFKWERTLAALNTCAAYTNENFYWLYPRRNEDMLAVVGILNSSWAAFMSEIHGRTGYGEGVLKLMAYEWADLPMPDLSKVEKRYRAAIETSTRELIGAIKSGDEKRHESARESIDDAIFDAIGLTSDERTRLLDGTAELLSLRKNRTEVRVLIDHPETKPSRKPNRASGIGSTKVPPKPLSDWDSD
jgi:methylase of polypeptide subunit release factors